MKKILISLVFLFLMVGCESNIDNTPTKKVEAFLNSYQMLDEEVIDDLEVSFDGMYDLNEEQKSDYMDVIKSGYQKMNYTIKEESIDGDAAIVTAQIEVLNHLKVLNEADNYLEENEDEFMTDDEFDNSLFMDYKIERLKENNETIEYTIDFTLTKINDKWVLDDITDEIRNKINGKY